MRFEVGPFTRIFPAHAAEVIPIERDRWLASRAGWGQGGLHLAELNWLD